MSATCGGAGRAVFIEGPPGKGKTRLLQAAGDMAREQGMQVLGACGSELERIFPFGVTIQLFEPMWLRADPSERERLTTGPARRAGDLLNDRIVDGTGDSADQNYSIIHGLFWLACNLVAPPTPDLPRTPVAMLIDDAHWADASSLRFLAYLAARVRHTPITLVLSARPGTPAADRAALAALRSAPVTTLITPRSLSDRGVARIISHEFDDPDPSFCTACARVTGGNPFLVSELLEQVRAHGDVPDATLADQLADMPPESVLESVVGRVETLSEDARRVIRGLAVIGNGTSVGQAAQMAEVTEDVAARAADELAAAHFIHPGAPLGFIHPLIHGAVRQSLAPHDRAWAHRRAASILQEQNAPESVIATHLLVAPAARDPGAVEILRVAARDALAKGSAEHAARLLERALAERPTGDAHRAVMAELAEAEISAGMPRAFARLEQAVALTSDPEQRGSLVLLQGRALSQSGRYQESADALESARRSLIAIDGSPRPLVDELEAAYVGAAYRVPALVADADRRAEEILAQIGDRPTAQQREALAQMALQAALRCEPRQKVAQLADRAWDSGGLADAPGAFDRCALLISGALLFADELEEGLSICEEAMRHARVRSSPTSFAVASYLRARPLYEQGRVAEAAADAQAALDVRVDRWEVYAHSAFGLVALGHLQRGRLEEAETALSILDHPSLEDTVNGPFLLECRAQLRLAQKRPQEALRDALEAGRQLERRISGTISPGVLAWRSTAALAHLALGAQPAAWELVAEELELARQGAITRIEIRDLRIQGLIERGKNGIGLLTQAVSLGDAHPRRLEHVEALLALGAALRRDNRRAAAREPLKRALELARDGSLEVLVHAAQAELLACGERVRRSMLTGVAALTPSQRRVAELAGQGLTTRMIAESLFITPKTVEFHLRQIYQKLEINSRSELKALLESDAS